MRNDVSNSHLTSLNMRTLTEFDGSLGVAVVLGVGATAPTPKTTLIPRDPISSNRISLLYYLMDLREHFQRKVYHTWAVF